MSKTNAENQRAYRERKKAQHSLSAALPTPAGAVAIDLALRGNEWALVAASRISELEAEVAHLKRQLASRSSNVAPASEMHPVHAIETEHRFNSRPFTPVPKR